MSEAPTAAAAVTRAGVRWTTVVPTLVVLLLASEILLNLAAVELAPAGSHVAAYWPSSGVSLVALALTRRRWRPVTLVGILVVTVVGNMLGGRELEVAAGFGVTNAAEAFLAFWLLTQVGLTDTGPEQDETDAPLSARLPRLDSIEDFTRLFVACALAAALGALLAAATVGILQGEDATAIGRSVFATHLAAMVLIVPLALRLPRDPQRLAEPLEVVAQWVVLAVAVVGVFGRGQSLPLVFAIYPVMVWGALRLPPRMTAVQLLVTGVVISAMTSAGWGPYVISVADSGQPPEMIGTLLQAHLLSTALVTLPLALMKSQRLITLDELSRSHEELDAILAATTATAIVGIGLDGRLEYVNVGTERLSGQSSAELVGRTRVALLARAGHDGAEETVIGFVPDAGPRTEALHELVDPLLDASGGTFVQDWTFEGTDGRRVVASVALSRRYDEAGAHAGFLAVAEDVTERRDQERATREALASEKLVVDRLAQLDQTKNDFLSTVSHELRTPITSIIGYSQLLLGQDSADLPALQRQVVGRIERNGRRLMGLIEDMLAMSQIEVGSFGVAREPLDVREPLALAVEQIVPQLQPRDLELVQDMPDEPVVVAGDADKLERAFVNLLSNAVKFSHLGDQVLVRLRTTATEAVFSVTDTGIGIAPRDQQQLFDRFFRGSEAHQQAIQGAGLGLSIASTIVAGHEGSIDIESAPGEGSTFTIRLPLLQPAS